MKSPIRNLEHRTQSLAQQPQTQESTHAPDAARAPKRTSPLGCLGLAFRRGLVYAGIQQQMENPEPLSPEDTWKWWTVPRSVVFNFVAKTWPPRPWRRSYLQRMISQDCGPGIEAHYDVSNEFYGLWLDRDFMFYTCAKYASPNETLEQAQRNKADYLRELLDPRPGEKILDLGCGWGGMMKHIASATGDKENLLGLSLSPAQVSFVQKELGLRCEHANFVHREYLPGSLDKVYSLGSLEHVRPNEIAGLHEKLFRALAPGGRVVHQFFSTDRDPYTPTMIALQQFFPGTILSRHEDIMAGIHQAGFRVETETLDDYRPTLRAWFDNLVANKEAAIRLVGVQTYNKYLIFLAASWRFFQDGHARLHRLLLIRP